MNTTRALGRRCEYHNNTHPVMTIIITGASIAATQALLMQEGGTPRGKHQAEWANSCPRSHPRTNVGSTTKHTKIDSQAKQKKQSHCGTYAMRCAGRLLDKPQIRSPGRASDTIPSGNRTSASNDNKNYHVVM